MNEDTNTTDCDDQASCEAAQEAVCRECPSADSGACDACHRADAAVEKDSNGEAHAVDTETGVTSQGVQFCSTCDQVGGFCGCHRPTPVSPNCDDCDNVRDGCLLDENVTGGCGEGACNRCPWQGWW